MKDNHENIMNHLITINEKLGGLKQGQEDIVNQFIRLNGQVQKHGSFINTWKGKFAIIGSIVGGAIGAVISRPRQGSMFHPAGLFLSIIGALLLLFLWIRYI